MNWISSIKFFIKKKEQESILSSISNYFISHYVDTVIYTMFWTIIIVFISGMLIGAMPFITCCIIRRCGLKCFCFLWILLSIMIIILLSTVIYSINYHG